MCLEVARTLRLPWLTCMSSTENLNVRHLITPRSVELDNRGNKAILQEM